MAHGGLCIPALRFNAPSKKVAGAGAALDHIAASSFQQISGNFRLFLVGVAGPATPSSRTRSPGWLLLNFRLFSARSRTNVRDLDRLICGEPVALKRTDAGEALDKLPGPGGPFVLWLIDHGSRRKALSQRAADIIVKSLQEVRVEEKLAS